MTNIPLRNDGNMPQLVYRTEINKSKTREIIPVRQANNNDNKSLPYLT
jgi:hypothetical protein